MTKSKYKKAYCLWKGIVKYLYLTLFTHLCWSFAWPFNKSWWSKRAIIKSSIYTFGINNFDRCFLFVVFNKSKCISQTSQIYALSHSLTHSFTFIRQHYIFTFLYYCSVFIKPSAFIFWFTFTFLSFFLSFS